MGYLLFAFLAVGGLLIGAQAARAAENITWAQANEDGFGDPDRMVVYDFQEFDGMLYACVVHGVADYSIMAYDGTEWTLASITGFGDFNNSDCYHMAVFNGNLYVGTRNDVTGAEVWAYDGTDWSQVNTDGFGDAANSSIWGMYGDNDYLYATTLNLTTGAQIWAYDGTDWTQIVADGFGTTFTLYAVPMVTFQDKLFTGTYNGNGSQLWAYDGTDWTQIGTDGFGTTNIGIISLAVYEDRLFIGTYNPITGAEIWTYDGTNLDSLMTGGFGSADNWTVLSLAEYHDLLYASTTNEASGTEVWVYELDEWTQINDDGFGNALNFRCRDLAVWEYALYGSADNLVTGVEVWVGSVDDSGGPVVLSPSPAANEISVASDADVSFEITDAVWDVDLGTLSVVFGDTDVILGGVFQAGYSGTIEHNGENGYVVTINPADSFIPGELISVGVAADDVVGNAMAGAWTFTIDRIRPSLGIVVTPASAGGPNVRVVDDAGTQISSFFAYDQSLRMGLEVEQADIDADGVNEIVITPGAGVESRIKAFELDGTEMANTLAFNEGFTGGVNVATGDFDGDHAEDIAVTPIGAGGPNIRIYTYDATEEAFELLDWFFGYGEEFRGGVNVAAGDLDNDGIDELIVTPRGAMSPEVKVFRYNAGTQAFDLVDSVTAYQDTFFGGVQVATGDVDSDGSDDIIVAPFLNGGPNIRIYSLNGSDELELLDWLMAYDNSYRGTLSMQVGDTDGDGYNEVVVAPKTLGDSTVKVLRYDGTDFEEVDSFMAYDEHFTGGVNLFVHDTDADGFDEVMASPASHGGPNLRVYDYDSDVEVLKDWFWVFPEGFRGGVNFGK